MIECVTDTHALIWHLFSPTRVGKKARLVLLDADAGLAKVYVPAVVVAELIMIIEKGRLAGVTMPMLIAYLRYLQSTSFYELLPLAPNLIISSHTLSAIPDIFDRLIVAETIRMNAPLLTTDSVIQNSGLVKIIWD